MQGTWWVRQVWCPSQGLWDFVVRAPTFVGPTQMGYGNVGPTRRVRKCGRWDGQYNVPTTPVGPLRGFKVVVTHETGVTTVPGCPVNVHSVSFARGHWFLRSVDCFSKSDKSHSNRRGGCDCLNGTSTKRSKITDKPTQKETPTPDHRDDRRHRSGAPFT